MAVLWCNPLLTYREVDGLYYVSDSRGRKVVVMNAGAFDILRTAHGRTVAEICAATEPEDEMTESNLGDPDPDVLRCLNSLIALDLLTTRNGPSRNRKENHNGIESHDKERSS